MSDLVKKFKDIMYEDENLSEEENEKSSERMSEIIWMMSDEEFKEITDLHVMVQAKIHWQEIRDQKVPKNTAFKLN